MSKTSALGAWDKVITWIKKPGGAWRLSGEFLPLTLSYIAIIYTGGALSALQGGASSIWTATGGAMGILLLRPKSQRPALLFIFFLINMQSEWRFHQSMETALVFAAPNIIKIALCVWLMEYFCAPPIRFSSVKETGVLLFGVVFLNGVFALLESYLFNLVAQTPNPEIWKVIWVTNALGTILIAPFITQWGGDKPRLKKISRQDTLRALEFFALLAAVFLFACVVFGTHTKAEKPILQSYMFSPILMWLAFRFTPKITSGVLLFFAVIATYNTLQGTGIFAFEGQTQIEHIESLFLYLIFISFVGLALSTLMKEHRQSRKALQASESKYRTVADFTYDWEAWRDPQGNYIYISPSCQRETGYSAEEFQQNPNLIVEIAHPSDQYKIREHLRTSHKKEEDICVFDFRITAKNGETRWLNHICVAVHDEKRRYIGRRESNRNISDRKRAEELMRSRLWLSRFADYHSIEALFQSALNEAEALTDSEVGFFHTVEADGETVTLQMWSSNTLQSMCTAEGRGSHYPISKAGVWADCARERNPIRLNDYPNMRHINELPKGHAAIKRFLAVPVTRDKKVVAIFGVGNKATDYDDLDEKIVLQMADLAWDIVQRKQSEQDVRETKEELEQANLRLESALLREQELAHTDPLTGINNRRYLFEQARREFELALRHSHPLSVILFDVDYFKKFNDQHGHDVGDDVLVAAVHCAQQQIRSGDIFGRYGGEEFVAILPMSNAAQAEIVAERIRAEVEALQVPSPRRKLSITVSVGVAETTPRIQNLDELIRRADEAMYESKQAGRNRVTVFQEKK